ncbi:MAG TPA: proline dehydrogenase family protein [Pseudonocardia sp.]|uniref:proline dehydrogenase family protein n=1 Tax=Pseudonocardia sp. TaxID=60912 RepID=UPI002C9A7C78|nr:proline dehydrogenase family protein [Pseudonocardia sp.]HTF49218.1 proline dehydrogenase family protein [Pseudonocardia sp.]
MLRSALLSAARSPMLRSAAEHSALARPVVNRFVAGTDLDRALTVARELAADRLVSVDYLGENTEDRAQADAATEVYLALLDRLGAGGLADRVEVSIKLSALGQALPGEGAALATDNAARICARAEAVGTTVTVDMEDHTTTDTTLDTVRALRGDWPGTGAVLQAYLRRTEADCAALAGPGSRVRLCKGAYDEPASVAFRERAEVDESYRRCLRVLMGGQGYPMVATHDPALIEHASALAAQTGRLPDRFEFQMLYGVRPDAQRDLAAAGHRVRVYLPYGSAWFPYFMRRLGERPANVMFFLRSVTSRH